MRGGSRCDGGEGRGEWDIDDAAGLRVRNVHLREGQVRPLATTFEQCAVEWWDDGMMVGWWDNNPPPPHTHTRRAEFRCLHVNTFLEALCEEYRRCEAVLLDLLPHIFEVRPHSPCTLPMWHAAFLSTISVHVSPSPQ